MPPPFVQDEHPPPPPSVLGVRPISDIGLKSKSVSAPAKKEITHERTFSYTARLKTEFPRRGVQEEVLQEDKGGAIMPPLLPIFGINKALGIKEVGVL